MTPKKTADCARSGIIKNTILDMLQESMNIHSLYLTMKEPVLTERQFYRWLQGDSDLGVSKAEAVAAALGIKITTTSQK